MFRCKLDYSVNNFWETIYVILIYFAVVNNMALIQFNATLDINYGSKQRMCMLARRGLLALLILYSGTMVVPCPLVNVMQVNYLL